MSPLEAALRYTARALAVLPIKPRTKEPLIAHGVHAATTDQRVVRSWFDPDPAHGGRWPDANIAIAVPPHWVVLDVDPRNGGGESYARLCSGPDGAPPATTSARTGSGGSHLIFARPSNVPLRGKLPDYPGIDLLSHGRYFLSYPSIHPCGGRYEWICRAPVAILPRWLLELARVPDEPAAPPPQLPRDVEARITLYERACKYVDKLPPAISGQGGHGATFFAAQALVRGFRLDFDSALRLLQSEYNPRCLPPWSVAELRHKLASALKHGRMVWGSLADAPMERRA